MDIDSQDFERLRRPERRHVTSTLESLFRRLTAASKVFVSPLWFICIGMKIDAYSSVEVSLESSPLVVALAACHQGQSKAGVDHSWMSLLGGKPLRTQAGSTA